MREFGPGWIMGGIAPCCKLCWIDFLEIFRDDVCGLKQ